MVFVFEELHPNTYVDAHGLLEWKNELDYQYDYLNTNNTRGLVPKPKEKML